MRKLLCIVVMCILITAVYGEEALMLPQNLLRLSQIHDFGIVEDGVGVSWGFGVEYGASDWLNLQLFWDNFLDYRPYAGSGSSFLGVKGYIIGNGAIVNTETNKFRLSAGIGLLIPPIDPQPGLLNQDQMLWGNSLRLYGDIIFADFFYINTYFEGVFYPPQYQNDNVPEYRNWVRHYNDYTFEVEAHFVIPVGDAVVLKCGVPIKYFFAPYMNATDELTTSQSYLSTGAYFGVTLPKIDTPLELYLRYNTNIIGWNVKQVHSISLITNITLTPGNLRYSLKNSEPTQE